MPHRKNLRRKIERIRQTRPSTYKCAQTLIDIRLKHANALVEVGLKTEAKRFYDDTLEFTDSVFGCNSTLTGKVLLPLHNFYVETGDIDKSKEIEHRIQVLVSQLLVKLRLCDKYS